MIDMIFQFGILGSKIIWIIPQIYSTIYQSYYPSLLEARIYLYILNLELLHRL